MQLFFLGSCGTHGTYWILRVPSLSEFNFTHFHPWVGLMPGGTGLSLPDRFSQDEKQDLGLVNPFGGIIEANLNHPEHISLIFTNYHPWKKLATRHFPKQQALMPPMCATGDCSGKTKIPNLASASVCHPQTAIHQIWFTIWLVKKRKSRMEQETK